MKKSGLSCSLALLVAGGATSVFAGSVKSPFNALNTQVNTTIAGEHGSADVTQLRDGGWLVTWHKGSEHWDVYQQRYPASGAKVDAEARVNTTENCNQDTPVATALADVGWLVTWQSDRQDRSEHWDIYQQRYAASGVKVGIDTQINTTENGDQTNPATTALADGGWLVTWESNLQDDSGVDVYQQRYAASGAKEGIETRVNTTTSRNQYKAAVATLADSGWLVTWESNRQDDSGVDIYQQRYAASGGKEGKEGKETRVNTTENCYQTTPAATALADGGWLVTWHCGWSVYQQRYAVSGGNVGDEAQVNSTTYSEDNTAVTSLADGGWVVTWSSGSNIYQQRYDAVGNPVGG
ncbi:hypothetical protein [Pseudomonas sp. OV226]|uniref:hypothetical protein n=1 Tax=Pseudomonas sp. OV226 TaxID=2135588 RepID=UPI0011B20693|nr:hypothetical protein [Pseudomonas sp. OV226]